MCFVFCLSCFVFRVLSFVFCLSFFVFRVSYFVFCLSCFVFRVSYFDFRVLSFVFCRLCFVVCVSCFVFRFFCLSCFVFCVLSFVFCFDQVIGSISVIILLSISNQSYSNYWKLYTNTMVLFVYMQLLNNFRFNHYFTWSNLLSKYPYK